jgi:F0F1-type ATP synthase epsilon subunit
VIEEKTGSSQAVDDAKAQQAAAVNGKPTMHIKIYSPFQVYFDEEGYSMSGVNATGPFDILPHHHNFLSLLGACELIIRPVNVPPNEQRIRISGGLMHVKADRVTVFLDV